MSCSNPLNPFSVQARNGNEGDELPLDSGTLQLIQQRFPFPDAESAGEACSDDVLALRSMSKKKNKKQGVYKQNGMGLNEGSKKEELMKEPIPSWYKPSSTIPAPTFSAPEKPCQQIWKATPRYLKSSNRPTMLQPNLIPAGKSLFEAYEEATDWLTARYPFANSDTQIVGWSINARDDRLAIKIITEYFQRENMGRGHRNPYWELSGAGTTYWDEKPLQNTMVYRQTAAWEWQV